MGSDIHGNSEFIKKILVNVTKLAVDCKFDSKPTLIISQISIHTITSPSPLSISPPYEKDPEGYSVILVELTSPTI